MTWRLCSSSTTLFFGLTLAACSGGETDPDAGGVDGGGGDGGTTGCMFDSWDITSDRTLTKACSPYIIDDSVEVGGGATLTVEAGVEIRIGGGEWIRVGNDSAGTLDVNGTTAEPVIITTDAAPTAGSWHGVIFGGQNAGSSIENAEIRFGGRTGFSVEGCITVLDPPDGSVELIDVRLSDCAQSGLSVEGTQFTATGLTFEDCETGLFVDPNVLGSVTEAFTYEATLINRIREGDIIDSATWVAQPVPFAVDDSLDVAGPTSPTLTLNGGLQLQFDPGSWLRVGNGMAASLNVVGTAGSEVIMRGQDSGAAAGSWHGLVLADGTRATTLDYLVVQQGGRTGFGVEGCLSIFSVPPNEVTVTNSRFVDCNQSGVGATPSSTFRFANFDLNTFERCEAGMHLNAAMIGSIGGNQTYVDTLENRIFGADVDETTTWRAQSIPWAVDDSVEIRGATSPVLTIEAGSHFVVDSGEWFRIGDNDNGGLVVAGTMADPVLFESEGGQAGDWAGIKFNGGTVAGSSLDYAVVRHAGRTGFGTEGCVTVESPSDGRVSIRNSSFELCNQAGVGAEGIGITFAAFENNTFSNMDVGFSVHPNALGSIAGNQTFNTVVENEITDGDVEDTQTWAAQPIPFVSKTVDVQGTTSPILSIDPGVRIRFDNGEWLRIGNASNGGLNIAGTAADPVVFESSSAGAGTGEWHGLFFGPSTMPGTTVDYLNLTNGGRTGFGFQGAVTFENTGGDVTMTNSTFSENNQSDVYIDCESNPTLMNNTYSSAGGLEREACPS